MSELTRRILIADDEADIREAFRGALTPMAATKAQGLNALEDELFGTRETPKPDALTYDLAFAAQGAEAVDLVRGAIEDSKPFGVVFLDMRMPPGIDGSETAKRIRAVDPAVNIVLVTGYSDVDVGDVAALVLPADKLFFIAKPFQVAEIRQQAAALSARWRHESALERELQTQNRDLQTLAAEASAARNDAERANVAKSVFLSNISHELRTPLNAIIGFSGIMAGELYGPLGDARYLDYAREIGAAGSGLLGAINDIIDTARLDIGKVELSREELDLTACLSRVVADLEAFASRNDISLRLQCPSDLPTLSADRRRLNQAIFGVVHNAVKFSPPGGRVDVDIEARDGAAIVSIRDNGAGMSPELIEAVQRPFGQGESEFSRRHSGLGLNLTLAKRLVELHGGRLEIESAPGKGTTIRIVLPAGGKAAVAA